MKKILYFFLMFLMLGCGKENTEPYNNIQNNKEIVTISENKELNNKIDNKNEDTKKINLVSIKTFSENVPRIEIEFSEDIENNVDLDAYIKISPDVSYKVLRDKNKLVINGEFLIGQSYEVKILKDLKLKNGKSLGEDITKEVIFNEIEPKIVFSNDGIILPASSDKKISFKSVNVKKINLKVKKIYENNITQFLHEFQFKGNGNIFDYYVNEEFYKFGDIIFDKDYEINSEKNIWTQTEIELDSLIDYKGLFIVEVTFDKNGIDYSFPEGTAEWKIENFIRQNGRIGKAVLLSDMGIIAQEDKEKINVTVIDVLKNEPVKKAKLKLISLNNQIIQEIVTDNNGEGVFDKAENKFYILAENGEEKSILKFKDSKLSYDGFAVDGIYLTEGIKSFIYTDRGIYRPGDDVFVSFIVRNEDGSFPENHPININVYSPTGKKFIDNEMIKNGKDGFYTYNFKTNLDSETGIWRIEAEIGGGKFIKDISVETVVPNKIKTEVNVPDEIDINKSKDISVDIKADYLFGAPGSNLRYESGLTVKEEDVSFEKYKNYVFKNPTSYDFYYNDLKNGVLDENGRGQVTFNLVNITPKNINLSGIITTKVLETNGRPVVSREKILLKKFDSYVGIEIPENSYIKNGDKINLQVIAVSKDGEKLISGKKLVYRVYKNEYSWWWDYNDYNSFIKSIKTDRNTVLLYEKEFVSGEKPYLIDYAVQGNGEIFVEVEDMETHQSTGINLYSSTWQNSSTNKKIDKLKIETDKKVYNIGEKANIIFEGTKGAKALVTLEKSGKIIDRFWKNADNLKNEIELEIKEDMFPNAYVTVVLFQDYNSLSNDRPIRLYGAVPIIVENNKTKLDIKIEAPDEIRPNDKFIVKVKNSENKKMDYTVAVVDEGLLGITGFVTPNPWDYFYQKEALQVSSYDNYSEIIGKSFGEVHQILKAGGDGFINEAVMLKSAQRAKELGIEEAQRFKLVAMFKGVLSTDENGEGQVEFTIPNYMGAVKVMVVGASGEKYGSAEKEIIVKAPIVTDVSLPRSLKVGDEFKIPVSIFALEYNIGKIAVEINFDGNIQKEEISLDKKENKILYFAEKVKNSIGKKEIKIKVSSEIYTFEDIVEIDVNSNNPYIYINELETMGEKNEIIYNQPKDYVDESVNSMIKISKYPIIVIDHRLSWLIRYPYGCVEQTTSGIFPQLYINLLTDNNKFDMDKVVGNINAGISKLASTQLYDGSFPYWPNGQTEIWVTNYVGHFIIEAKSLGYFVPEDMYNKWINFTKKIVKSSEISLDDKAYSLYLLALAEVPDISEMNLLYENYFDELELVSKWYVAAAYKLIGDNDFAKEIAQKLSLEIKPEEERYKNYIGNEIKDKAVILNCYNTIFEKTEEKLYSEVIDKLQSNEWLSTESTGYSLMSIAKLKGKSEADEELSGIIYLDEKEIKFTTENGNFKYNIPSDVNTIKIISENKNIFTNFYWEGISLNYDMENISENIKIERNYYDDNGNVIDPKILSSGESFWLEVKVLPVESKEYFYVNDVALVQVLPSGWEIENMRALGREYPQWIEERMKNTYIEYEDIRDDRVMWFFDFDNYNSYGKTFFVKINAITPGKYDFPGTTAEGMYNNNYQAYLKGFRAEVK